MKTWTSLLLTTLVCTAALLALSARAAHAYYLDPGSGSYLFQMAIAGALGGLFALRQFFGKWRGRVQKARKP